MGLLNIEDSVLIIIDIQEKLVAASKSTSLVCKASKLASIANILNIPVIVSEQYPKGLGYTVNEIKSKLPVDRKYIEKTSFSLLREEGFSEILKSCCRKQIILCGIETHICVYQTAKDLIDAGYEVTVVKDICASRNDEESEIGISSMKASGAEISSLEMIIFEWLKSSRHPHFKEIQSLIK